VNSKILPQSESILDGLEAPYEQVAADYSRAVSALRDKVGSWDEVIKAYWRLRAAWNRSE
jgi:hypothetical protein